MIEPSQQSSHSSPIADSLHSSVGGTSLLPPESDGKEQTVPVEQAGTFHQNPEEDSGTEESVPSDGNGTFQGNAEESVKNSRESDKNSDGNDQTSSQETVGNNRSNRTDDEHSSTHKIKNKLGKDDCVSMAPRGYITSEEAADLYAKVLVDNGVSDGSRGAKAIKNYAHTNKVAAARVGDPFDNIIFVNPEHIEKLASQEAANTLAKRNGLSKKNTSRPYNNFVINDPANADKIVPPESDGKEQTVPVEQAGTFHQNPREGSGTQAAVPSDGNGTFQGNAGESNNDVKTTPQENLKHTTTTGKDVGASTDDQYVHIKLSELLEKEERLTRVQVALELKEDLMGKAEKEIARQQQTNRKLYEVMGLMKATLESKEVPMPKAFHQLGLPDEQDENSQLQLG